MKPGRLKKSFLVLSAALALALSACDSGYSDYTGQELEGDPDYNEIVDRYCYAGAKSKAQYFGCVRHVTEAQVRSCKMAL